MHVLLSAAKNSTASRNNKSRHISLVATYPDGTINIRIVEKQQGYCSGGMLSDSIKYQNRRSAKLICDPRLIPINQKK